MSRGLIAAAASEEEERGREGEMDGGIRNSQCQAATTEVSVAAVAEIYRG